MQLEGLRTFSKYGCNLSSHNKWGYGKTSKKDGGLHGLAVIFWNEGFRQVVCCVNFPGDLESSRGGRPLTR